MQAEFNGLPLYKAVFPQEADGILRVSLVDRPAVESDFMFFSKVERVQTYSVSDEEKRLVRGVILRADYPIYRVDPHIGEYYIMFDPKEIRELAERYLYDGRQNRVNVMHQANSEVAGVNLRQIFIKDSKNGIDPKGFEQIEEGSLFGEYHITNDAVWEEVKKGTYKGFSVEIVGTIDPEIFKSQTKQPNTMTIKVLLKKFLVKLASVTTDKGILVWDGEEELNVGDAVMIEAENGEGAEAPEGDYKLEDGTIIKVAEGKVAEIIAPEADTEEDTPAEEEMAEEEAPTEEETPDYKAEIEALKAEIEALKAEIEAIKEGATKMSAEIEKFAKAPAVAPAHEEFRTEQTPEKGASLAARIAAARKK